MPVNGDIEVPAPVPYSLDDADGIVAASWEAVAAVVEALPLELEVTELTLTGVSIGKVDVFVEPPDAAVDSVLDAGWLTPDA
jgi:hypothetical protein